MLAPSIGIVLGVVPFLPNDHIQVDAFAPPASLYSRRLTIRLPSSNTPSSSLCYGPRDESSAEENDVAAALPSPPFSADDFQKQMNDEIDPTCSIDDEDCLAFSSLDDQPLVFNSNTDTNEDPLCDPSDVDCQAFLPKTYLRSDTTLAAELKVRSNSIERERIDHNWRTAHCPTKFFPVSDSDWVRRVAMETYPMAVCGSARGGLYVVDLEEKKTIAKVAGAHTTQVSANAKSQATMDKLYGKLDGGGVVSVAIHGDLIASAGREGGVGLWWMVKGFQENGEGGNLVPLGSILGLDKTIVTSLKFDSKNLLWVACDDGTVRAYNMTGYDGGTSAAADVQFPPKKPVFQSDFTDSVLDMHLCEELKLGVCATADGGAALFNMENGQFFAGLMIFEGVAARSVLIVKHKSDQTGYSVVCGGADGAIHRIPLKVDPETGMVIDEENPFLISDTTETAVQPKHTGPVMCMATPEDGMFVSGGQDGALRVWDCAEDFSESDSNGEQQTANNTPKLKTKCMYALTGYKLWLGSVCTDGKRLVSDGGENSIITRDFSSEPGTNGKASL